MPVVMLKKDWPGLFRRVIRDDEGKAVVPERVIEFAPGEAVEVEDSDMPSLLPDVELGTLRLNPLLKIRKADAAKAEQAAKEPEPTSEPSEPPATIPMNQHHRKHRH